MANPLGTNENPLRVAVFGSGPAGFYACEHLLKQTDPVVSVDLFDKLPTPYGLVRGGVAPDHQKIKNVIRQFEKTAGRDRFRFFGNVAYGRDVTLEELLGKYHQVLFCTGTEADRRLKIPGEDLFGSHPATEFVGWYNGHPEYRDLEFDLSAESVAVVGNGNVAMDVVRILARPIAELEKTDIADHALEALKASKVKTIWLLGRRGPSQAKFTNPEIRELTEIPGCDLVVREADLELDPLSQAELEAQSGKTAQRNLDILAEAAAKGEGASARKIRARFFVSPVEVLGTDRVEGLKLEHNALVKDDRGNLRSKGQGTFENIDVQLVFRSVGYMGTALPDLPFDDWAGTIPNDAGRVLDPEGEKRLPRRYVAGWIKRGPSGVIGTNKPDAVESAESMLADFREGLPSEAGAVDTDPASVPRWLTGKGVRFVSFDDWKRLDALELERGKASGRPRVKYCSVEEMLAALG